jgi:hypothetical protein
MSDDFEPAPGGALAFQIARNVCSQPSHPTDPEAEDAFMRLALHFEASPNASQMYADFSTLMMLAVRAGETDSAFYERLAQQENAVANGSKGGRSRPRPAWEGEGKRLFKKYAAENPNYVQGEMADYIRDHMKDHDPVGVDQTKRAIRRWKTESDAASRG